jgi:hypothetical protein
VTTSYIPILRTDDLTPPPEREKMIAAMKVASADFYRAAARSGCHAFIEFTGLMNEYIKLCQEAHEAGVDFTKSNVHCTGASLPMQPYHADYIGEKLECIFAQSFSSNPDLMRVLVRRLTAHADTEVDDLCGME